MDGEDFFIVEYFRKKNNGFYIDVGCYHPIHRNNTYLLHNNGTYTGIIKYTGKTANSFTGCTRHNGDNQIASGSEIVPISIV